MNRILSRILVGCVAACAATSAWAGFTSQATIGETDWGKVLEDGCIYTVDHSFTLAAGTMWNALKVKGNATAVLYIPSGITFTVTGGVGGGTRAGYAAIGVPLSSTLIVTGEGRLVATGGKAGNGSDAPNAASGGSDKIGDTSRANSGAYSYTWGGCDYAKSYGGNGGAGGGGAGAGIGGDGGWGAETVGQGVAEYEEFSSYESGNNGNSGGDGSIGSSGTSMGSLYVVGPVTVAATGGARGSGGSGGTESSDDRDEYLYWAEA